MTWDILLTLMRKRTCCKKDIRNTHLVGVIGLHIAIFAGPKDRKGNSFFSFFFSFGHKQKHNV